ncbi:unnamed protein product [Polarella glacialis]|uniref:Pectin acetylesterase n=1 Tax=Polarella glacialis TaxID=89957 RepID=A0A813F3Y5_POLGL|nr:unnamed protein product [Polarella glacialis]
MAGYYWRQGAAEGRYLLFFEGGGWCYDANCDSPTAEGTLADCRKRSEGRLGSSNSWSATKDGSWFTGMLSSDLLQNPIFNNWTLIYLPYCDGTSWSGDAVVDGLHFRGRAILDAVMTELGDVRGITSASQVVLSGGSAGASAVLWHGDALAGRLRRVAPAAEVVALPDAGFFLDLPDRWGTSSWPRQMRSIFNVSNGYGSLHLRCPKLAF